MTQFGTAQADASETDKGCEVCQADALGGIKTIADKCEWMKIVLGSGSFDANVVKFVDDQIAHKTQNRKDVGALFGPGWA